MNNFWQDHQAKWLSQYRKGYLELCVLLLLQKNNSLYGQQILKQFNNLNLSVSEGALYPLLNRMEKANWLQSVWQLPEFAGHPKRVYSLNPSIIPIINELQTSYQNHHHAITQLTRPS